MSIERFKERVRLYREAGIALESLSLGCSVKIDLYDVLYPALQLLKDEIKKLNLIIAPREDAAIMPGESAELKRVYLDVEAPDIRPEFLEAFKPSVAIVLVQLYMGKAGSPDKFAEYAAKLYKALGSSKHRVWLGKGHSIVSTKRGAEFFMVDFLKTGGEVGYVLANNDTIQVIDPSEDFDSWLQIATSINNALNDLYIKGVYKDVKIAPVYDAPEGYRDKVEKSVLNYASSLGELIEVEQPTRGYLLLGATAYGYLDKEPPLYYDRIDKDYVVIVSRPFGELAYFTTYVAIHTDEFLFKLFEEKVMPVEKFEKEKRRILELMATPNVEIAKVIYKHLPNLGERFKPEEHIAATIDVSGPGIFVFKEIAEKANVDVELFDVPLLGPEISKFAAENYIMPDATAGTNGAVALLAHKELAEELLKELSRISGLKPAIIGRVVDKGTGKLYVPNWALQYISSNKLKEKLSSGVAVLGGLARITSKPARARFYVEGDVQGVGFRPMARARGKALGLTGYVKNLPDGRVEVVVEGDLDAVRKFSEEICKGIERCKVGEIFWEEFKNEFRDLETL